MLKWALIFLVVAIISGLIGFTNLVFAIIQISKVVFYISVILFIVFIALYWNQKSKSNP